MIRKPQEKINFSELRAIGDVAETLKLPPHVLRFWETRFRQIKPVKRAGGRRFYQPGDIALLEAIRHLLYQEGYTIRGVQRILKEQGIDAVVAQVDQTRRLAAVESASQTVQHETALNAGDPRQKSLDLPLPAPKETVRQEPHIDVPAAAPVVEILRDEEGAASNTGTFWIQPSSSSAPINILYDNKPCLTAPQRVALLEALTEIEECKRLLSLTLR